MWRPETGRMLRAATDNDYEAFFGRPAPAEWFGLVEARPYLIEGIGCIFRCTEGRYWLAFVRCPGVSKVKTAHAAAKKLLSMAEERGLTVHALADPDIQGSSKWIERLGFRRSDETKGDLPVWTR